MSATESPSAGSGASSPMRGEAYTVRPYTAADEEAALRLHERGFGRAWPRAFWRWRSMPAFGGEPSVMAAFTPAGRCAALLAGMRVPCRCRGVPGMAISVSNSVLEPELARSLAGARLFLRVVDRYIRHFREEPVRLMYGSPIPSLVRAMSVHLGIEVLGDVHALVHHLQPERIAAAAAPANVRVGQEDAVPREVDALWERCAGPRASGVVRNHAFVTWRFAAHPQIRYRIVTARGDAGDLRGLAVLRDGGWRDDVVSLCEWIVPDDDAAAEAALLAHAVAAARLRGAAGLVTSFSANTAEYMRWQARHGFVVAPTSHQLVFRTFGAGLGRAFLFDAWRLTMADLEFL